MKAATDSDAKRPQRLDRAPATGDVRIPMKVMREMPERLVFLDETSVKTNLTLLRGRAPVGERLPGAAPFGKCRTQTFIAGLTSRDLIAPWVIGGR